EVDGKVPMLSEEWWDCMVHAVNEGKRIGVDIGAFNSPGWSQSGGPWVTPEMAMRYVNYSEVKVSGSKKISLDLVKPHNEFEDLYVLAFPTIKAEENKLTNKNSTIKISNNVKGASNLLDGKQSTVVEFNKINTTYTIDIEANKVFVARSILIHPGEKNIKMKCELLAKVDGEYKSIKTFTYNRINNNVNVGAEVYAPVSISLPTTKSKNFKLKISNLESYSPDFDLSGINISGAVIIEDYIEKHLGKMHPTPLPMADTYKWTPQPEVNDVNLKLSGENTLDISKFMDSNGKLTWDAPKGDWTIQRYGLTPTGTKNAPAAPRGKGYEIDKANREIARFHFEKFIGEFLKRIPEESKSAFKYVVADSYEMGSQNWTDGFEGKFEKKFGYSPTKYLPVFSGRVVGSIDESERFLWDLRRWVADAVAYEYVGGLRDVSNENNLKLWLENYGHWGFPSEFLMYGGQSDLVSGEFWNEGTLGDIECKAASSSAHIYGKPITSAEAFTASFRSHVRDPSMLKKRGDWSYTEGINHFVLHVYIHQPDDNKVPGVNAWFSTEFNRHNTWFDKSSEYFNYLRRCQHLLQKGKYKADVCYFIGEDAPIMTGARNPELPNGYSYDYINAEVILERLSVKDGKLVLPDGMTYNLMVLPPSTTMRPKLLAKIESLVKQGGKIYGKAPVKSPSLQGYPNSDKQVMEIAERMWAGNDKIKSYGKGFIIDGLGLQESLNELGIQKDVEINTEHLVLWTHHTMPGMEIYFLTNQSEQEVNFTPSFRVKGMKPQLWNAITGEVRPLNEFTEANGRISVPITMESLQSWFVVFSNETLDSKNSYAKNFPKAEIVETLENSWKVEFANKKIGPKETVDFPALTDWIENADDRIKFYSGTATYSSTFNIKKENIGNDLFIDLGKVGVMATVKINGIDVGTTWIAPFNLDITKAVKEGENTIEVEVVNVWRNRITGDKTIPETERTTSYLFDSTTPEEELISSGLLGPVTIQSKK
ncbi:MAG: hypothetical protein KAG37_07230, partial [Flavobacteriales bacterium]|nr:hypothetical protein [Flavobacteriales bacterium]